MIGVFVQEDLASFSRTFEQYWKLTSGSRMEALQHTAKNFAFLLWTRMKGAAIPKGTITRERIAAFKAGQGIKISNRARELVNKKWGVEAFKAGFTKSQKAAIAANAAKFTGSKIGLRKGFAYALMAQQELRLRESHRMFTASAARFKGALQAKVFSYSKGKQVGVATPIPGDADKDSFEFEWGSQVAKWSGVAAVGLNKETRRTVFGPAMNDTRKDMLAYITRKQQEIGRRAARVLR